MRHYAALNYWVMGGFEGAKSPYQAIDEVKEMGLDGVELTFGEVIAEDISKEECEKIATYAKEQGIGLRSMAAGFYWGTSLGSPDDEERSRAIEFTKHYIQAAAWLGVERILVIPGAVDVAWDESRPVVPYDVVWDKSTESLKEVLPLAEELGIMICLENVWNKFLLSPMEFQLYLDQFDSKSIGIYLDVGNTLINGYPQQWIRILGDYVGAIHFKNFNREDAGGVLHNFGDELLVGDVDFDEVLKALEEIDFSGPISAEMIPFCRLPDMVLPDMELARKTAADLLSILR